MRVVWLLLRPLLAVLALTAVLVAGQAAIGTDVASAPLAVGTIAGTAGVVAVGGFRRRRARIAAADIANVTLAQVVRRELERSRRHEHPLGILRIPIMRGRDAGAAGRYLALTTRRYVRAIDEVVAHGDSLYVVMPETSGENVLACWRRLVAARPAVFEGPVHVAAFPDDGVTVAALLAKLHREKRLVDVTDLPRFSRQREVKIVLDSQATPASEALSG